MLNVAAAVLISAEQILMARRAPGQSHAGMWEFPGGKLEPGEDGPTALCRELWEELHLQIVIEAALPAVVAGRIQLLPFRARVAGGELTLTVHDEVVWDVPARLWDYPMNPGDRAILAHVLERS